MDQSDIWIPKCTERGGGGTDLGNFPKFYHFFGGFPNCDDKNDDNNKFSFQLVFMIAISFPTLITAIPRKMMTTNAPRPIASVAREIRP